MGGMLTSAGEGSSSTASRVDAIGPSQISALENVTSKPKTLTMKSVEKLPDGMFLKLVLDYLPPQDW
jgi:hypothetical protein